ncbi:universal stress protein [Caballeronia humi]|uniref:Universal stress protein n=1 Tax=Caballeronia humi TaxID=326474 RepID=A0A158HEN7_9BURK|nr:universal stress protein [Caballeronia humi]SAL42796.1 universal stress protein [Caballeronia humi]
MYRHLLLPIERGGASAEALGHVTELARTIGARITFLWMLPSGGEPSLPAQADEDRANEVLTIAEAAALAQGVACSCAKTGGSSRRDIILNEARQHGCDLICLTAASPDASALQALDMTLGGDIAVLVCPVDARPTVARSIGALFDDYHAINDELNAWSTMSGIACGESRRPGTAPMRESVARLCELQRQRLRPKQHGSLYPRLRERTSVIDAELDELEFRHRRDDELLGELARIVGQDDRSAPTDQTIEQALAAYAKSVWEWMGREQGVVLPAARRYLSDADWTAIDTEFNATGPVGRPVKQI